MNTETWITVCERLPAVSEPVLTYDEASRTRSIAFLNNGRWLRDYPDPMLRVEVRVTHWQPLPELPPIRDGFEEFWREQAGDCPRCSVECMGQMIPIHREAARWVWNYAVESTKST